MNGGKKQDAQINQKASQFNDLNSHNAKASMLLRVVLLAP